MDFMRAEAVEPGRLLRLRLEARMPGTMLITAFDYPDILRAPTSDILTQFAAGGLGWLCRSRCVRDGSRRVIGDCHARVSGLGDGRLVGSLLWLGWLIALGIALLRQTRNIADEHAG